MAIQFLGRLDNNGRLVCCAATHGWEYSHRRLPCAAFLLFLICSYAYPLEMDRHELTEVIAYALWKNHRMRPQKKSLDQSRIWAKAVVAHLELCRIEFKRLPPRPWHDTPSTR